MTELETYRAAQDLRARYLRDLAASAVRRVVRLFHDPHAELVHELQSKDDRVLADMGIVRGNIRAFVEGRLAAAQDNQPVRRSA